jgi:two-component system, chemotaxis family, response regulator Rcp1
MASQKYSSKAKQWLPASQTVVQPICYWSRHHVRLMQEALTDVNSSINQHVADDGINAMAFLRHEGINVNAPCPDLILLDLNLPRMDGREVLMRIKTDDNLKTIPTIILSSSELDDDVMTSYRLHANAYLKKPLGWMRSCAW